MNTIYFAILFFLFIGLNPVKGQYNFDAVERNRMVKAKVKTQTQWAYDYVNGKPSAKGYRSLVKKYDTRGNITEVVNYNKDGKLTSLIAYQYDNRNNVVNFEQYNDKRQLLYSLKIAYNANGWKTRENGFDGSAPYSNTYLYDANGRLIEINYTVKSAVVEKRQLKYSGNKTEISVYDQANNLAFKQENTYNDMGLLMLEKRTSGSDRVMHTLDLKYNNIGDMTQEVKKRADDKLDYQKFYQYDSANRPIKEETVNLDGQKFVSREYKYGDRGDLTMESWKKNDRTLESSTKKFTYDTKGLYTEEECYYATYKLNTLYRYTYEFY